MNAPLQASQTHPVAALFGEHGTFVFRTLRYFGVRDDAADDALQDVFTTAYRRWASFEGRAAPRSWLYGISRRVAYRYRRSARSRGERFVFADVEREARPFDQAEARATVAALLDALDDRKREAFVLVEIEGFTAPEAAAALEVPLGTVYSRVRAAWQSLREAGTVDLAEVGAVEVPRMGKRRKQAAHRAVIAGCVPAALGASMPAVGVSGWLVAASIAGLAVVGGGAWTAMRSETPAGAGETPQEPAPADKAPRAKAQPSGGPVVPSSPIPATSVEAPGAPGPRARATPRRAAAGAAKGATRGPAVDATADTLAAEIKLIRGARAARDRGDAEAAKRALGEHARRFPNGQLADERNDALAGFDAR